MSRRVIFATLVLAGMLGCNKSNSTSSTPVTTTTSSVPGPTSADISGQVVDYGLASSDGSGAAFFVRIRLTESAGVAANINFFRLDVLRATGELEESAQVGASDIIAALGSNKLEASSTWENNVVFFFRATIKKGRHLIVTVNLTDDKKNVHELSIGFTFG